MRGAGCHPNLARTQRYSRPTDIVKARKECNRKICEVNQIGANHSAGGGSQTQRISFKEVKPTPSHVRASN
jgi:hypothetical protein